jgi:MFS family permease
LQPDAKRYLVCALFQAMTTSLSSLIYNLYLVSLGYDAAFIGMNNALLSGARLVCALPAGMIADRIGRKRSMIVGLSGMAAAQLGLAVSPLAWTIVLANLVSGVFGALFMTSIAPFLTETSKPDQRALLFTLNSSLMNVGSFVASTGGGYLPRLFASLLGVGPESAAAYRGVMLTAAGTLVLALVPVLLLTDRRRRPAASRATARGLRGRLRRSPHLGLLLRLVLPRTLMAFGAGLVFPFLNLFYKQRFGVSDAVLGWILGITNIVAAAAMLWGGAVAERLGKVRAALIARSLSIPGLLVIGFVPWLPVAVLAHWVRSALMRLGEPLYMAFAMEQLEEDARATGSSVLSTGWNVGWSIAPYVSGILQPSTGWGPLFLGTIGFYVASVSLMYAFFVRGRDAEVLPIRLPWRRSTT